jgi:hypothetical protein
MPGLGPASTPYGVEEKEGVDGRTKSCHDPQERVVRGNIQAGGIQTKKKPGGFLHRAFSNLIVE